MNQGFDTITELNTERFNTDEEVFLNLNSDTMTSDLSGGQDTVKIVQITQQQQQQQQQPQQPQQPQLQQPQLQQPQQQQQQEEEESIINKFDGDIMINVLGIVMALILIN